MEIFKFDEALLANLREDIRPFTGKCVDVAETPIKFSGHLDKNYAKNMGVTEQELSIKWAENEINSLAKLAALQTVTEV